MVNGGVADISASHLDRKEDVMLYYGDDRMSGRADRFDASFISMQQALSTETAPTWETNSNDQCTETKYQTVKK